MRTASGLLLSFVLLLAGACVPEPDTPPDETDATSELALTVDLVGGTDVGGMHFRVTEVPCAPGDPASGDTWEATADFEDMYLPGGIPTFEEKPYDSESTHLFSDHAFFLPAGCYDVVVTPLDQEGNPSDECHPAHRDGLPVWDGQTTETTLISQCEGPDRGLADVIATINHPPRIDDVTYSPSKFVATCEGVDVCVTASDPDNDPLEFVWEQTSGGTLAAGPTIARTANLDGSVTECATIVPGGIEAYEFEVTVYDLAYDDSNDLVRIEQLLSAQGDPHESRDSAEFPLYSGVDCTPPPVDPPPVDPPDEGCTLTQGYWKNHNKYATTPSQQIPWPISEDTLMCGESWLEILETPPAGDKWYILAHQYIAARLNIAKGASTPAAVIAALSAAEALLPGCSIDPADEATAIAAAETLDDYNNGLIGPGHCD